MNLSINLFLHFYISEAGIKIDSSIPGNIQPVQQEGVAINVPFSTDPTTSSSTSMPMPVSVNIKPDSTIDTNSLSSTVPTFSSRFGESDLVSTEKESLTSNYDKFPALGDCGRVMEYVYENPFSIAKINRNPWNALLQYKQANKAPAFNCGGALISDRYVITAASCVLGIPSELSLIGVILGEWNISKTLDCENKICSESYYVNIDKIITHEGYKPNAKNHHHDIALIRLKDEIRFTEFVSPICIPFASHLKDIDYADIDLELEAVGWLKSFDKSATDSDIKLRDLVEAVDLDECNLVYAQTGIKLKDSQICIAPLMEYFQCIGDQGGPLIALNDDLSIKPFNYIVGIASLNVVPCLKDYPRIYTNVAAYSDWIEEKVTGKNFKENF